MNGSIAESIDEQGRMTASMQGPHSTEATRIMEVPDSADMSQPRVVGTSLPLGSNGNAPQPQSQPDPKRLTAVPPLGRALTTSSARPASTERSTGLQRAVGMLRAALPVVQRLLPLIDGNIATTVSNILSPPPAPVPPPPAPKVDLAPIEATLIELKANHRDLREQVVEQNSSLKRVEDQLQMVREATDRNTLEQQELLEDLKGVGSKVNILAVIAIGLLAVTVLLNLLLYMHIQRVLP